MEIRKAKHREQADKYQCRNAQTISKIFREKNIQTADPETREMGTYLPDRERVSMKQLSK